MTRRLLLLCGFFAALTACAGPPRGWSEAVRTPSAGGITGAWSGTWRSEVNGHHGALHCLVEPRDTTKYHFRYRASWAHILSAGFQVTCDVRPRRGGYEVTGQQDLGTLFGGLFSHQGTLRGDTFSARYHSKLDRGVMEMRRISP